MEQTLTIKPARQSNILKDIRATLITENPGSDGTPVVTSTTPANGLTIPGIQIGKRIRWNHSLRKYHLGDLAQEELDILVTRCKFKNDMANHPDKGRFITTADPYDFADPFFNNRLAIIKLDECVGSLSSERPFEKIFSYYAKNAPLEFIDADVNEGNLSSLSAKYTIINSNNVIASTQKSRLKSEDASKLYFELNDDKKLKIAMYLGVVASEATDRSLIDDVLWKICIGKDNNSEVKRDLFIDLCKISTEKLSNRYIIAKAKGLGFLKKTNKAWNLQGIEIGRTDLEVESFFDDINNQDVIDTLEKKIVTRKK